MSNMDLVKRACAELKISTGGNNRAIQTDRAAIRTLINRISEIIANNETTKIRETSFTPRQTPRENFTLVFLNDRIDFMRTEEVLERMINKVWSNNEFRMDTQYALNKVNAKEDIDIVLYRGREIKKIVELKYGSNTPFLATVELIKNFLILKKANLAENIDELIVLAPEFFYDSCTKEYMISLADIFRFIKEADKSIPDISIKSINLADDTIKQTIRNICDDPGTETKSAQKSKKPGYREIISFKRGTLMPISAQLNNWQDYRI